MVLCAASDVKKVGKLGSRFFLEEETWRGDCMVNAEPGGLGTIRFAEKGTLGFSFHVRTEGAHRIYVGPRAQPELRRD